MDQFAQKSVIRQCRFVLNWRKLMCLIGIVRLFVDKERNWLPQSPSKNKILLAFAVTGKAKISQLHIINVIESDSRYTIPDITKDVGLSLSRVHFILKRIFECTKDFCHMDIAYIDRWPKMDTSTKRHCIAKKCFPNSNKDNL